MNCSPELYIHWIMLSIDSCINSLVCVLSRCLVFSREFDVQSGFSRSRQSFVHLFNASNTRKANQSSSTLCANDNWRILAQSYSKLGPLLDEHYCRIVSITTLMQIQNEVIYDINLFFESGYYRCLLYVILFFVFTKVLG